MRQFVVSVGIFDSILSENRVLMHNFLFEYGSKPYWITDIIEAKSKVFISVNFLSIGLLPLEHFWLSPVCTSTKSRHIYKWLCECNFRIRMCQVGIGWSQKHSLFWCCPCSFHHFTVFDIRSNFISVPQILIRIQPKTLIYLIWSYKNQTINGGGVSDEVFTFFTMEVWKSPKNITLFVKFFIMVE